MTDQELVIEVAKICAQCDRGSDKDWALYTVLAAAIIHGLFKRELMFRRDQ